MTNRKWFCLRCVEWHNIVDGVVQCEAPPPDPLMPARSSTEIAVWPEPPSCEVKIEPVASQPDWAVDVYAKMADMCRELNAPVASPPAPPPVPDTEQVSDTEADDGGRIE